MRIADPLGFPVAIERLVAHGATRPMKYDVLNPFRTPGNEDSDNEDSDNDQRQSHH
jgi:hypothetical protein